MNAFLTVLSNTALYLAIFSIPLAFLPLKLSSFALQGEYIVFFLLSLSFLARVLKMVLIEKEIRLRKTYLDLAILLFLIGGFISAVFSKDSWLSLAGVSESLSGGFAAIMGGVMLYFLLSQKNSIPQLNFMRVFFVGSVVSLAVFFLLAFKFNSSIQVSEYFLIPAALSTLILTASMSYAKRAQIVGILSLGAFILFLAMANSQLAWAVLTGGLLSLLFLIVLQRVMLGERLPWRRALTLAVLLFLGISFLFSPFLSSFSQRFSLQKSIVKENALSQGVSLNIAFQSMQGGIKNILVGSGLGTFVLDASLYGPWPEKNLGETRTMVPANYFAQLLAEGGTLVLLSFLLVLFLFFAALFFLGVSKKELIEIRSGSKELRSTVLPAGAIFGATAAFFLLSPQNFLIFLLFWFSLGQASFGIKAKEMIISLRRSLLAAFGARIALLCLIVLFGYIYKEGIGVAKAQKEFAKGSSASLEKAVALNPRNPEYAKSLAFSWLEEILAELKKASSEQDRAKLTSYIQNAFSTGQKALDLSPKRVDSWEAVATIYKEVPFVQGSSEFALNAFKQASSLEPLNPVLYNEAAKLELASKDFISAREHADKALSLTPSFKDALLTKALIIEQEGDLKSSLSMLQSLFNANPEDTELMFQLGRIRMNNGDIEQASSLFRKVLQVDPSNSNAHFALGSLYEKQGNAKEALKEFETVLRLNPDNKEVLGKIQQLQAKK